MTNYGKIKISGEIELVTGLHIGGTDAYSAIGAVDSPVIRDAISGEPTIPGSSIKGKMRFLLQKTFGASMDHNKDHDQVLRLFGSSAEPIQASRLKFSDCFIQEGIKDQLRERNIRLTETKTENAIKRTTSVANPRQIERVIRGIVFDFEVIYDVLTDDIAEIQEDFKNISTAFKLLENDYLGGHGSRGSGRVKFNKLKTESVYGEAPAVSLEV